MHVMMSSLIIIIIKKEFGFMNPGQSIVSCTKMLMVMVRSSNLDRFVNSGC